MNFGSPQYAPMLLLIPAALLLGLYRARTFRARLQALLAPNLIHALIESSANTSRRLRRHTFILTLITLLLVISALRPQWGYEWRESKRRGGDIALAIDVSESMLAADVSPSRLERAKRKVTDLLSMLRGDRVALVAFAGIAFVETPLTLDYAAFKQFLPLIQPELIPIKGSNLEVALRKSLEALGIREGAADAAKGSAIILLTDGEELDGDLEGVGKLAAAGGVRIYVLGIGSTEGAPIPTPDGYKKDQNGKVVITRLKPDILERVALLTGGTYVQSVGSSKDIETIYKDSLKSALTEKEKTLGNAKQWNEYYQFPLAIALLLILFVFWGRLLGSRAQTLSILALFSISLCPLKAQAQDTEALGQHARDAYEKGDFQQAEKAFANANQQVKKDRRLWLGLGSSQYRQGKFADAQASFAEAMQATEDANEKGAALYNLGNSFVQEKHYKEAIQAYEQSLKFNANDRETSDNLAYARRLLKEQEQQKKNEKDQQQKDQKKEQEDSKNQSSDGKSDSKQEQNSSKESSSQESSNDASNSSSSDQESTGESSSSSQASGDNESNQSSSTQESSASESSQGEQNSNGSSSSLEQSSTQGEAHTGENSEASSEPQTGSQTSESKADPRQDELETLLKSVEEKYDANTKFRVKKALEEMKAEKRKMPEKDW